MILVGVTEYLSRRVAAAKGQKDLPSSGRWRTIQEEFLKTGDAAPLQKALTEARDESVVEAFRTTIAPVFPRGVAMLAGGAYARGQTFPYSELDIILLLESGKQSELLKDRLPEFVRLLWNEGLRPNSIVLTLAECMETLERAGVAAFTLLARRMLAGDNTTYEQLTAKLPGTLGLHREKLRQRLCQSLRARHTQFANTPFHAEPDVKEGPGGLQDARLIDCLALLKGEPVEQEELKRPLAFLSSARCFLHYIAECDHNTLDFDAQASVAHQEFAHPRTSTEWMREYFECAGAIFNDARRAVEESERTQSSLLDNFREYRSRLSNQELTVSREHLLLRNPAQLSTDPMLLLRTLEFIARHGVPAAPETERRLEAARDPLGAWFAQPQPVWPLWKSILACPHAALTLRILQSTGLMRVLFPEWGFMEHLVVADSEYRFTVDEQTLRFIDQVLELKPQVSPERQRFAGVLADIDDPALLVFALLFHDIGIGTAHPPEFAAERAHAAALRMQMPEPARNLLEFQILHASDLSEALNVRDLDDPATVRSLADRVGTIEQLRLLTVLTYARIAALTEPAKIQWRLDQLWRAFNATQHELIRELEVERIQQAPEYLPGNAAFVKGFPLRYLRAHSPAEIEEHLRLFEDVRRVSR